MTIPVGGLDIPRVVHRVTLHLRLAYQSTHRGETVDMAFVVACLYRDVVEYQSILYIAFAVFIPEDARTADDASYTRVPRDRG